MQVYFVLWPIYCILNHIFIQTDRTALYLIGAVAGPIAQDLVNGASLSFTEANITSVWASSHDVIAHKQHSNISNDGFDLNLQGSLINVGPLDALIEFVEPLTCVHIEGICDQSWYIMLQNRVTWQGHDIATITLPSGEQPVTRLVGKWQLIVPKFVLLPILVFPNTSRQEN